MNFTRKGKIARLPPTVREEINRRLLTGKGSKELVPWLNALPEVQAVMAAGFGGKPIRQQNLSEWMRGGYREWEAQQEVRKMTEELRSEAATRSDGGHATVADTLALWVAARYAVAMGRAAESGGAGEWQFLRGLCADVVKLRRGDHSAERLRLERERRGRKKEETGTEFPASGSENCDLLRFAAEPSIHPRSGAPVLLRPVSLPNDRDEIKNALLLLC